MKKALITLPVTEEQKELFQAPDYEVVFKSSKDVTAEDFADCEIIIGNFLVDTLNALPDLKWVQLDSAGANRYTTLREDIALTNASGAYGDGISEYMLAYTLACEKNLYGFDQYQRECVWHRQAEIRCLNEETVLCIGMGNIGSEYAKKMHLFGARVIGIRRTIHDKPDFVEILDTFENVDKYIPEATIIALSLPETPETINFIDKKRLNEMRPDTILINVGRGSAIDTLALVDALNNGKIAAACLDVTAPEPLPKNNPLWNAKNAHITPHITGGWFTEKNKENVFRIALTNYRHYMKKEPLEHVVNRKLGY